MGGFVLAIKDVFLELLIKHISKGSEQKEIQALLQERIDWAFNDDLDGVIGSICAQQFIVMKRHKEGLHARSIPMDLLSLNCRHPHTKSLPVFAHVMSSPLQTQCCGLYS